MVNSYRPGSSCGSENVPSAPVVVLAVRPVPSWTIDTAAPDTTAPLASTTLPMTIALKLCARMGAGTPTTIAKNSNATGFTPFEAKAGSLFGASERHHYYAGRSSGPDHRHRCTAAIEPSCGTISGSGVARGVGIGRTRP